MCKKCLCHMCYNEAEYTLNGGQVLLCNDCYESMKDDYESEIEMETGKCFEDYFDVCEL